MEIGCVVMASGLGTRFAQGYKLLAELEGKPLICHLLSALPRDAFSGIVVVTRNQEVADIAQTMGFPVVLHTLPYQSDTIKLGLEALGAQDGYLFCVADQPRCSPETILHMIDVFTAHPENIVRLHWGETPANPILFPAKYRDALCALTGEQGGAVVARQYGVRAVQAQCPEEVQDIDTLADFQGIIG